DFIFDLGAACDAGLFEGQALDAAKAASGSSLNAFFALGAAPRKALRGALQELLGEGCARHERLRSMGESLLQPMDRCQMHVPANVGDYTDFYVGIHHANNVGKLFRPDNPLLPNYKYVPIGYHGRASTIDVSGATVKRPNGQTLPPGATEPSFGPSKRLDLELELGIWIGQGNARGEAIPIGEASSHVAGFCLLNDWSARDLQAWEYQPLGPFLSKSFATSVSPWVVTPEALEPFRCVQPARPEGDPQPLPYLYDEHDQQQGALDIELEVLLLTEAMRDKGLPAQRITVSSTRNMYWTVAQMVAHHSVNGCSLQPGDLFGSGTLSGESKDSCGSLLEITQGGKQSLELPSGETRTFLEDGDEIILRARCRREGYASIGFGECRGRVMPASR
ncbi:MAG TPA: fumarylacetoacetase, partial [Pseudomonas sp.]|nr:fumarylacetoacetase [Pseudomonas sp.]